MPLARQGLGLPSFNNGDRRIEPSPILGIKVLPRSADAIYQGIVYPSNSLPLNLGYFGMKTSPDKEPSKMVKSRFVNQMLDEKKLEKAKEAAKVRIKRNKRLGDLLAQ